MSEPILTCQHCGKPAKRLMVCEDCFDELRGERATRLARTVTACSKALAIIIISCMEVLLSHGKDRKAMATAMNARDSIAELDRVMKEL